MALRLSAAARNEAKPMPITHGKLIGAGNDAQGMLYSIETFAQGQSRLLPRRLDKLIATEAAGHQQHVQRP